MLNNPMQNQQKSDTEQKNQTMPTTKAPNESGQLYLDDFVRIFDPNNQEVLLEKRS
jgi:hypothetical protein